MATRPPELIAYSVEVGPGVDEPPAAFAAELRRVLTDPRGWQKYGYRFTQVDRDLLATASATRRVRVRLETAEAASRLCGMRGFSCQRPGPGDIVFNLGNWRGGSASQLPLERYRNYVVNHEFGHLLGLRHQRCPIAECHRRGLAICPASVMQQMTRGPCAVAPCVESDWPLDPDWLIDDPRRAVARKKGGDIGCDMGPALATGVAIMALAAGVVLAVILTCARGALAPARGPAPGAPRRANIRHASPAPRAG